MSGVGGQDHLDWNESQATPEDAVFAMLRAAGLDPMDLAMAEEGLTALLASLAEETSLSPAGRSNAFNQLRKRIEAAGQVAADRRRHPAIADVKITRPLVITGLPRSGTTILHSILAQDPDTRSPLSWEIARPSPPPEAATHHTDPRIGDWVRANLSPGSSSGRADPEFRKKHLTGAQLPEECGQIIGATLRGTEMWARYRVASYVAWWLEAEHTWDYQVHRRWLQHFQWRNPRTRWALKWPNHIFHLGDLLKVYPDACIVQLHRDPREVISSISSLIRTIRSSGFSTLDTEALGREMLDLWATGATRSIEFRLKHPGVKVADVSYRRLLETPIEAIQDIYAAFEIPLTNLAEGRMQTFLKDTPQNAHGEHRHSLGDYGLCEQAVSERMHDYCDRFAAYH